MNISTFKAFQSRNYRLYFAGQSVSLIGTWMQRTAVSWVVFSLTGSSFMLGLALFAGQFPSFLFSLFGGVISDRYNKFKVLLATQVFSMVQATLLALMVIFTHPNVWAIMALSVVLGIINAFDVPARQSLVVDMVGKQDLHNALALNSSMVNVARLIGPAVSGLILKRFGEGTCFSINAISFIAVITSLLMMRLPKYEGKVHDKKALEELQEGMQYLKRTPSIGYVILMLASISFFVLPYNTLLPIYAKVIFRGDAATFGYINSFIGLGAVAGALFLASLKAGSNLTSILLVNTLLFGGGLIVFSHITIFPIAMVFATITGFGMMSQTTISNTLIQTKVHPSMRGRVISYFAMAFFGMMPLGALLIGAISNYIGAANTVLAQGITCVVIALLFAPFLRRETMKRKNKARMQEIQDETVEKV